VSLVVSFQRLPFSWKFSNRNVEVVAQLCKFFLKFISFSLQAIDYDLNVLITPVIVFEFPANWLYLTVNSLDLLLTQLNLSFNVVHDYEFVLEAWWKIFAVLNSAFSLCLVKSQLSDSILSCSICLKYVILNLFVIFSRNKNFFMQQVRLLIGLLFIFNCLPIILCFVTKSS
jgi:hypothetical protein